MPPTFFCPLAQRFSLALAVNTRLHPDVRRIAEWADGKMQSNVAGRWCQNVQSMSDHVRCDATLEHCHRLRHSFIGVGRSCQRSVTPPTSNIPLYDPEFSNFHISFRKGNLIKSPATLAVSTHASCAHVFDAKRHWISKHPLEICSAFKSPLVLVCHDFFISSHFYVVDNAHSNVSDGLERKRARHCVYCGRAGRTPFGYDATSGWLNANVAVTICFARIRIAECKAIAEAEIVRHCIQPEP